MITENQVSQSVEASEVSAKANAVAAREEARAFVQRIADLFDEGRSLKPMARKEVARMLGESVQNKHGRPGSVEYVAFVLATLRASFKETQELAKEANSFTPKLFDGGKLPVQLKISGNAGGEKVAKIRLNKPVELDGVWE